jgi:anti-sigma regulatory factor (Ser/Thr protein kinase)
MAPSTDSPGLGLGLPLIARISQRFEIRKREVGGTRLCIWFDKEPGAATLPD